MLLKKGVYLGVGEGVVEHFPRRSELPKHELDIPHQLTRWAIRIFHRSCE
jgi:hypothetical protein